MKRFLLGIGIGLASSGLAFGQLLSGGLPNPDDDRLYAWYDGNEAIGFDGIAGTPVWPNRLGNPDRDIAFGFGPDPSVVEPVETENGNMALRFENAVAWQNEDLWGGVEEDFTVFVAATVRDPAFAYFFTGNRGGGETEANANFQTEELDTWSLKSEFRFETVEVVADELQFHAFTYTGSDIAYHYINSELVGEGEVGFSSMNGFVLGGRQNGNQRATVDFAEVMVIDGVITDDERNDMFAYLNGKFFGGPALLGDFDSSGALDVADIDLLTTEVQSGNNTVAFDLNSDNLVNGDDRQVWVEDLRNTYFGDSNLDGEFNSSDFVVVFNAGQYEDGVDGNSTWASGDWNGDGDFSSTDFVAAFSGGGYEIGPRAATSVNAVPEPSGQFGFVLAVLSLGLIGRRSR